MDSINWIILQIKNIANRIWLGSLCLMLIAGLFTIGIQPGLAGIQDDTYDGNIFVVYAGNGSLLPSRQTLAESIAEHKPSILLFYVDDSSDCKKYAIVLSQVQAFYGKLTEIIPVNVDSIPSKSTFAPTEPGYYYSGGVPQVVIFNQSGEVVLNQKGAVPYEQIDDKFREIFNLAPRTETSQLKRRAFNEFSGELSK